MRVGVLIVALAPWACDPLCDKCDQPKGPCATEGGSFDPIETGAWWRLRAIDGRSGATLACPDTLVSVESSGSIRSQGDGAEVLRPGVQVFRLRRELPAVVKFEWLEAAEDGDYRHVEETFSRQAGGALGTRSRLDFFCPRRLVAPEGPRVCEGHWTDVWRVTTVTVSDPGRWPSCLAIPVDPTTCAPEVNLDGCRFETAVHSEDWFIEAVEEPTPTLAGVRPALRVTDVDQLEDDGATEKVPSLRTPSVKRTQRWSRGLGEVRDDEAVGDSTALVDVCVPSDDCRRVAPSSDTLAAECFAP